MKIDMSSAEFDINQNIMNTLFPNQTRENRYVLSYEDIDKLKMWDNYRAEIKQLYNKDSISLNKDIHGQYWIFIGGTGWAQGWTVNIGDLKI